MNTLQNFIHTNEIRSVGATFTFMGGWLACTILWLAPTDRPAHRNFVLAIGNLIGTLVVIYSIQLVVECPPMAAQMIYVSAMITTAFMTNALVNIFKAHAASRRIAARKNRRN